MTQVPDDVMDPAAQLAALKAERAKKDAEREGARAAARLADMIAREKRGIEEDEIFAKLLDQHGVGNIKRINTKFGMAVVVAGEPIAHRRFQDSRWRARIIRIPKVRTSMHDAADQVRAALRRLSRRAKQFDELCEKVPHARRHRRERGSTSSAGLRWRRTRENKGAPRARREADHSGRIAGTCIGSALFSSASDDTDAARIRFEVGAVLIAKGLQELTNCGRGLWSK
jgi:hypothetical protein